MSDLVDRLPEAFAENFSDRREVGAAISVWQEGREVANIHGGFTDIALTKPWGTDTLVLIWSATKGLASACLLHALEKASVALDVKVAEIWPEFGGAGKGRITIGQVLSHQAGLAAVDDSGAAMLEYETMIAALERQAPNWPPGTGHGYGPRTFGFLADELVRRLSGIALGDYWRREFADPLDLDVWIGLPEDLHGRVAQMIPPQAGMCRESENDFDEAMQDLNSLTRRAFSSGGLFGPSSMNSPAMRSASLPSLGGIGSATSLAKFYAMLALGGEMNGMRFFDVATVEAMARPLSDGDDLVLRLSTAFSTGFMCDPSQLKDNGNWRLFGPGSRSFGHPGAGGSLAFADLDHEIGFAYVMNQMGLGILPQQRARSLVTALYQQQ